MIVDLHSGQYLTPQHLIELLAIAPRLVVGEQHDNPDHHAIELWLLQALEDHRPQGSLLLEMLEPVQQSLVDRAAKDIKGGIPPADLPAALGWQKGWDWALYGPVLRFALGKSFPVLAANLNAAEARQIREQRPALQDLDSVGLAIRETVLTHIQGAHGGVLSESQLGGLLAVQLHRDRRMAENLIAAPAPAVLFAGSFHARKDVGVPQHLADSHEAALVLMLAERGATVDSSMADYAWFSAPRPLG